MDDRQLMQKAIDAARDGIARGQTPFGACIAKDGEVIIAAHNLVWAATDITAHAEIVTIREACKKLGTIKLGGCTIYSTTEPCPMCFSACHWAGLDRIVFGAEIADARAAGFGELSISNSRMKELGGATMTIEGGFMRKQAVELFEIWKALEAKPY